MSLLEVLVICAEALRICVGREKKSFE